MLTATVLINMNKDEILQYISYEESVNEALQDVTIAQVDVIAHLEHAISSIDVCSSRQNKYMLRNFALAKFEASMKEKYLLRSEKVTNESEAITND